MSLRPGDEVLLQVRERRKRVTRTTELDVLLQSEVEFERILRRCVRVRVRMELKRLI